jgi:hypothetical protein
VKQSQQAAVVLLQLVDKNPFPYFLSALNAHSLLQGLQGHYNSTTSLVIVVAFISINGEISI